jgi:hypothetical protein
MAAETRAATLPRRYCFAGEQRFADIAGARSFRINRRAPGTLLFPRADVYR